MRPETEPKEERYLTIFNLMGEVCHPHGDIGGQDDGPGDQDGQAGDGDCPQGDRGHREHHRQEPGHIL